MLPWCQNHKLRREFGNVVM